MKINWFSPLPPAMTDIAHYTARILASLREHAEIVLWTDQAEWEPDLERIAPVRRYEPERILWDDLNRGDVTIFNIGNNTRFHSAIWQVLQRHPGAVVLHDMLLQHFFLGLYKYDLKDRDGYLNKMGLYHGQQGREKGAMIWDGLLTPDETAPEVPLTHLALERAMGVIVHTRSAFLYLKDQHRWPARYLPLPYIASPTVGNDEDTPITATGSRGFGPPYGLVVFGYIGANRRVDALLKALAGYRDRNRFRLSIYGQLANEKDIRALISSLRLEGLATVHGFVPEKELDAALSSAHLAVNLRYPTMGEASGSQLRIWHHGLPSLVSAVGWYADIPESAVAFVRPDHEVEDIRRHLDGFLENPGAYAKMGETGREMLREQHHPSRYAEAVVDFAKGISRRICPDTADYLAGRCAAEMIAYSDTGALEQTMGKAARAIAELCSGKGP